MVAWRRAEELAYAGLGDAQMSRIPASPLDVTKFTGEALDSYVKAHAIAAGLAGQIKDSPQWQFDLWAALSRLARVKTARGEFQAAHDFLTQGVDILKPLVAGTPSNAALKGQLGMAYWQLATLEANQGKSADALSHIEMSVTELEQAGTLAPAIPQLRHDLAVGYQMRSQLNWQSGHRDTALEDLRKTIAIRKWLLTQDSSNGMWELELIVAQVALGSTDGVPHQDRIDALEAGRALAQSHVQTGRLPVLPPNTIEAIDSQLLGLRGNSHTSHR